MGARPDRAAGRGQPCCASPGYPFFFAAALVAFAAYALMVAFRRPSHEGAAGLAGALRRHRLFLVLANYGVGHTLWMASLFLSLPAGRGAGFLQPAEVLVVVAVCIVFCAVRPRANCCCNWSGRWWWPARWPAPLRSPRHGWKRGWTSFRATPVRPRRTAKLAREEERQRIASDFHDGPLQSFISLQMRLEILRKLLERDLKAGMEDLKQLQALAQSQVRDLRTFLHSMRPVDVDGGNLVATARRTAESFQKESGIPVTFMGTNTPVGLPQETDAGSAADAARSAAQRAEARRRHARGGDRWRRPTRPGDLGGR